MLEIRNLHAAIDGKEILKGIDLTIGEGEIHAIMGPNGAGKSTLSAVLTGRDRYEVTEGEIIFKGKDLLAMSPEERSREGIFLSFQYPVEIPGVSNANFMKAAVNAHRKAKGMEPLTGGEFLKLMKEKMQLVQMKSDFAKRDVNVGFSGGEKKRNEVFQMAMLEPTLAILDETDSGLDYKKALEYLNGYKDYNTALAYLLMIQSYPRCSISLASSLPASWTMRPPASTCTLSGTIMSRSRS